MVIETFSHKFDTYNPHQLDAYLLHLADVNNLCGAVAAEDIYNSLGVLIVNSGAQITPALARSIMHFTLVKPLELSVRLDRELDAAQLETDLIDVMQQDDILQAINEYHDLAIALKTFCKNAAQYSILRQKLTVMAHALPEIYKRSLYCAWLSFLIAKEMRLSEQDIAIIFIAALGHDIGLLHIDADILNRKATLSSEDWLRVQMHVVIGSHVIIAMPNIPVAVAQAVYEHHERCDGTGYPQGKVESELGLPGMIVGLADSVVAIYYNRFKTTGGSWRDVIPIVHMNTQTYFSRNYEVLVAVFRRSELPLKNVVHGDETLEFIVGLAETNTRLKNWFETMHECLLSIGFRHGDRRLHSLQNVMLHVSTSVEGSGVFKTQQLLLNSLDKKISEDVHREIESVHMVQQEIIFHLQRLSRMTQLYLDSDECKKDEIKSVLAAGLAKAQNFLL